MADRTKQVKHHQKHATVYMVYNYNNNNNNDNKQSNNNTNYLILTGLVTCGLNNHTNYKINK